MTQTCEGCEQFEHTVRSLMHERRELYLENEQLRERVKQLERYAPRALREPNHPDLDRRTA